MYLFFAYLKQKINNVKKFWFVQTLLRQVKFVQQHLQNKETCKLCLNVLRNFEKISEDTPRYSNIYIESVISYSKFLTNFLPIQKFEVSPLIQLFFFNVKTF